MGNNEKQWAHTTCAHKCGTETSFDTRIMMAWPIR